MFPLYDLNPHRRFPWVTVLLIVANVAVMASQGWEPMPETIYSYGFIPRRVTDMGKGKALVVPAMERDRRGNLVLVPGQRPRLLSDDPADVYLTFLTTMFLHGGWLHLLTNMWMLWVFGNNVEDRLGRFMFLCYYLLGGMVGSACQWAYDPMNLTPVIGASGAVATVLGGYAITYPKAMVKTIVFVGIPLIFNLPALVVLGFWLLTQMVAAVGLLPAMAGDAQVAFWAHIGGFVAGVALMPLLALGAPPAEADWKQEAKDLFRFDDPRTNME